MLDARRREILKTIGVDLWELRQDGDALRVEPVQPRADSPSKAPTPKPSGLADSNESIPPTVKPDRAEVDVAPAPITILDSEPPALGWDELQQKAATCTACALREERTQVVFGVGHREARLMIIGEAPGAEEDRKGEPFVGRAGLLLNAMLAAIGFGREEVYIANIVKCRPPGNRDPHADEAAACQGYLYRQIELVSPDLILSVGRVSAHNLLHTDTAVGRLRGRTHRFQPGDIPLIVTYHPAYLLRRPEEKAKAWQDLQAAFRLLQ